MNELTELLTDPLKFQRLCWPELKLYDRQVEIIQSVVENDETIVPAGNQLGKDFIAAFIALWFFCSRSPCRVVTSSVDQSQLRGVLWGEIRRFIQTSRIPLPLLVNDLNIRRVLPDGQLEPLSYLIGRVALKGEGLLGHHIAKTSDGVPRTLYINDESSGAENECWDITDTWAHRKLAIGNPYPCNNFFFTGTKAGDLKAKDNGHYYRKIIRIKAEDSPNVRLALAQIRNGIKPTGEILIPGVKDYETYLKHRELWDSIRQCIGLDAEFYEGADVLLYPPAWLNRAETIAASLGGDGASLLPLDYGGAPSRQKGRIAEAIGVDTAEGGDSTVWTAVDRRGIIEQVSKKTRDTAVIPGETIAFFNKYRCDPNDVLFDRGGGGKEHADYLRKKGHNVRTVGFGEPATDPHIYYRFKTKNEKRETVEDRYAFKNRRAEMYWLIRELLNPEYNPSGFGIPARYVELRRQLAPLPLLTDGEGRIYLPPKNKPTPTYKGITITQMLGRSPDEADSLALAVFGMQVKMLRPRVGAIL